ncbi:hypothetical protein AB4254_11565 [Vibrio breoganii]
MKKTLLLASTFLFASSAQAFFTQGDYNVFDDEYGALVFSLESEQKQVSKAKNLSRRGQHKLFASFDALIRAEGTGYLESYERAVIASAAGNDEDFANYWSGTYSDYITVLQRDDLIDLEMVKAFGEVKTLNKFALKKGISPIGYDMRHVQVCKLTEQPNGLTVELAGSDVKRFYRAIYGDSTTRNYCLKETLLEKYWQDRLPQLVDEYGDYTNRYHYDRSNK